MSTNHEDFDKGSYVRGNPLEMMVEGQMGAQKNAESYFGQLELCSHC